MKDIDLSWYRQNVGYVGQEPVLFNTTIMENMRMSKPNAKVEEIEQALKDANAFKFI